MYCLVMTEKTKTRSYLCSSADWDCLIESAESALDAASQALAIKMECSIGFSVGAIIEVVPVTLKNNDASYAYSPFVLANMGMHKFASEVAKELDNVDHDHADEIKALKKEGIKKGKRK